MMKQTILLVSMLVLSIASFAKDDPKRNPSNEGERNGLVMGMPIPVKDMACRRAAFLKAVNEAMEDSHHVMDCEVTRGVQVIKENSQYAVHVDCKYVPVPGSHVAMAPEDFDYKVFVHATRATKNRNAGCKVDKVSSIEDDSKSDE
jgi:hypothetical protein